MIPYFLLLRGAGGLVSGPCSLLCGCLAAACTICGCIKCMRCQCRACRCCKRCLRLVGYDDADDFELLVIVQEAKYDSKQTKVKTHVRVRAGSHEAQTGDDCKDGLYEQPLHILIEQGTTDLVFELLSGGSVLATHTVDIATDVLGKARKTDEHIFRMTTKSSKISNAKLKVTMNILAEGSLEAGLAHSGELSDYDDSTAMLVEKQLQKIEGGEGLSRAELTLQACAGPLEVFQDLNLRLGGKAHRYVAAYRISKRCYLGIWNEKRDHDLNKPPWKRVDLLRIQSVQRDPSRNNVFAIYYFDESRVRQILMFNRVDRNRDVWVSLLHDLVENAHKEYEVSKSVRHTKSKEPSKRH